MRNLCTAVAVAVTCSSGCASTYAAPIRAAHAGAPARVAARKLEIGGSAGGLTLPVAGGPHVAVGLEDWASLEVGGNFAAIGPAAWALGWAGGRLTRAPSERVDWAADLEAGLGAGVGGADCAASPCGDPWTLAAGGGYAGFGVGLRADWLSVYVRGRLEMSAARQVGLTLWPTAMAGLDIAIEGTVLGVGGGYVGAVPEHGPSFHVWFYQLQVAVQLDLAGEAPAAATPMSGSPARSYTSATSSARR